MDHNHRERHQTTVEPGYDSHYSCPCGDLGATYRIMRLRFFHLKRATRRLLLSLAVFLACAGLTASRAPTTLEIIQSNGVLRMITFTGPTTYYTDAKGENGFEYVLARAFANYLGVKLEVSVIDNLNTIFIALGGPRGDFAAAGLTATAERQSRARFSTSYQTVTQKLIYRLHARRPNSVEDLIGGSLVAIASSSHTETLTRLKIEHPQLEWQELPNTEMLELMQMVHDGDADYAIVDSSAFDIDRSLYPKARAAFDLTAPEPIAWAFPNYGDDTLVQAANVFLQEYQASGHLARLEERFFDHTDGFSIGGSQLFVKRVASKLPEFQTMFEDVAQRYGLDWHLVAAIAYQESHWNPRATSPTGVRGLMMLTTDTAREMGVSDRLDAEQSLRGGVEYLLQTKARIPAAIVEPDRTWLALAAYNIGLGHLEDARVLTERAGMNPNRWRDVRKHLPLLSQRKYYSSVKHGVARGTEPVHFVQNIRHYRTILQWHALEQARLTAQQDVPSSNTQGWRNDILMPL